MAIRNEFIEEVRSRNDIVAVLSEYLNLKRTGSNYKCLCPFHHEDTSSFVVSPSKQIYHCFGCQEGGNVFSFVMKMDNLTFIEAVEKLAQRVGLTLPDTVPQKALQQKNKEKEQIISVNDFGCLVYSRCLATLPEAVTARRYLAQRGLTPEIIATFKLGYAPQSGEFLLKEALRKGFGIDLLKKAGLIGSNAERCYDYFRKRIVYPIMDAKGKVVGFGARALDDGSQPKYLNTQETSLFAKSKLLYGLSFALASLRQKAEVVVVEGYMDVIACQQFGIKNCVATMGVALTSDHVALLRRYCQKITLVYDSDRAGVAATLRSLELLLDSGLEISVASALTAKDPDEFLHKYGAEAFEQKLRKALPAIDFTMGHLAKREDVSTVQGKVKIAGELLPLVLRITNPIEQKEEIKKIAAALGLGEEVLLQQLSRIGKKDFRQALTEKIQSNTLSDTGYQKAQKELLALFLTDPNLYAKWHGVLTGDDLSDDKVKRIFAVIAHLYHAQNNYSVSEIIDYVQDEALSVVITQLTLDRKSVTNPDEVANELVTAIKKERLKERYVWISSEISRLLEKNETINTDLFQEYQELTRLFKGSKETNK